MLDILLLIAVCLFSLWMGFLWGVQTGMERTEQWKKLAIKASANLLREKTVNLSLVLDKVVEDFKNDTSNKSKNEKKKSAKKNTSNPR